MKQCQQTLCFQLKCNCNEQEEPLPTQQSHQEHIRQDIYTKFAQTLQLQLQKQHETYSNELDELNNQVFNLKNTILKLELRNKKDNEAHQELRRQYNILLQKIKDKEPRVIKEIQVVQRIKEIPIQTNNEELLSEIKHWKSKTEEGAIQFQKMRMDRDLNNEKIDSLKDEVQRMKKKLNKQEHELEELKRMVDEKDRIIQKLNNQIVFLKNNKQVIIETKHLFPEFKPPEKIRTQTKIETIYVEKPVQRPVFVQIERRVKQFIQPERPIVNRIISCPQQRTCQCQEQERAIQGFKSEIGNLQTYIDQLENNITSYKSERQNLVEVIGAKNSQLNYLQKKMRLYGGTGAVTSNNKPSTVNVIVSRQRQYVPVSEKIQAKNQKYVSRK